jgi:hypothetical protein
MKRATPLVLALVLFFAVSVLWIVSDRRAAERIYDRYSSASTAEEGLSLAAGYLGRNRKVAMLTRPIGRERLESNAVVFRVTNEVPVFFDPEMLDNKQFGPPKPKRNPLLNDAEEAFVRRGGRMIIASPEAVPGLRPVKDEPRKVFPIWPRVEKLATQSSGGWPEMPPRMHAILASGKLTILARQRIGAGELFVFSTPDVLSNAHLVKHLELLHALAGDRRPVYFDEVAHGIVSDDGALALLKEWNLGPFLVLLAAIAALVFWRAGRRVGPPEDDHRETRSEAIDLVRSLGALYDEVTSNAAAIALYHEALTRTVASQSGLRGDALRKRVDALTHGFVPPAKYEDINAATFKRQLAILNEAFLQSHGRTAAKSHRTAVRR